MTVQYCTPTEIRLTSQCTRLWLELNIGLQIKIGALRLRIRDHLAAKKSCNDRKNNSNHRRRSRSSPGLGCRIERKRLWGNLRFRCRFRSNLGPEEHARSDYPRSRATPGRGPVIVLSARDPVKNDKLVLEAGAVAFFQKPPDNSQFLTAIRQPWEKHLSCKRFFEPELRLPRSSSSFTPSV